LRGTMPTVEARLPTVDELRERHERLLGRLRSVAEHAGHDPDGLRIVGIT